MIEVNMAQYLPESYSTTAEEKTNISETEFFVFPVSFAQQRLWFLNQLFPNNPSYNVPTAIRLTGSLNLTALEQTFNEIVRRHETLRTSFMMLEGELVQVIAPNLTIPLPVINLQNISATKRENEARQLIKIEAKTNFNLAYGPLLRVTLLQLSEAEYVLLLNLHHIVSDGWSIGVLIREIRTLYTAFSSQQTSPLPSLSIQYADYSEWQREWLQGEILETQLTYWKQKLNDISVLNLPTDRTRPASQSYQGSTQFLELSKSLSEALISLSQQEGVTLFITLLTAFQSLLYRYTGQEDIAVGSPIANRNRSEIEALIGFFVNSLVLRTDLSGNPTFRELLNRVKEVALGAYAHQDVPFEKLVEELHPERNMSLHPLFQVVFSLQNTPIEALELPGLTLSLLEFDSQTAKFDLEFHLWECSEGIRGQVVYSTDLFDDATITRMLGHFQTLIESIVANPDQRVANLLILTEVERHQLLIEWNDTDSNYTKNLCIHQLFEAQVERTPDGVAVVFEEEQFTYRELNNRSNQLAHYLQKLGVKPEVLVGICIERSLEMIVGLLGILKAGGCYVPLDPSYPQERLNFMLEDAGVSVLLTQQKLFKRFEKLKPLFIDKDWKAIAQESQKNPTSGVTSDNLAYVIYTSGSTGNPKGVLIHHQGLCNLSQAQIKAFNIKPTNRILQFASLSFDASIFEIVMAITTGATLYLAKKKSILPGQTLIQFLRDKAITNVTLPPSVLAVLPTESLPALQTIISAGEACSQEIVKHWLLLERRFFNAYGPTEATVWTTVAEIIDNSNKPSIGRPIFNTHIYILDAHLQPVPIGIYGEIYIDGDGVARGYLNRPELTAEKFIPNPFNHNSAARLYKTGDLARYRNDGNIEFLGRTDNQVKIRGFRIEIGEIEAWLSQHPLVREAVVITSENASGNKYLVAYIVPDQKQAPTTSNLRQFLQDKLPEYMIPSAFVMLDSLPRTPNGKVERRHLLLENDTISLSQEKAFLEPRTPTEKTLAKIWAEILNLEQVGIDDNFFQLGGDSLLAIGMMAKIKEQFEQDIPLSALFLNQTIAGLATSLNLGGDSLSWSPLIAIQSNGSNPPLFCVHPIFGTVFPYYELAYNLGANQPFYGLQPIGIDGAQLPLTSIEDMATQYIEALRRVQPEGPYFLGGWSFGGLVVFEMAQQLIKSGHQVALLAVLDTPAPIPSNKPSVWDGLKFLFTTAVRYVWPFFLDYFYVLAAPNQPKFDSFNQRFPNLNKLIQRFENNLSWNSLLGEAALANLIPQESRQRILSELTIRPMLRVFQANSQATLSYVPQVYPNQITLFKSSEQSGKTHQDSTLGWSKLTEGGVEVQVIPGNHLTMLKKPHVQVVAEQLRKCIEKAHSKSK